VGAEADQSVEGRNSCPREGCGSAWTLAVACIPLPALGSPMLLSPSVAERLKALLNVELAASLKEVLVLTS